MSADQHAGFLLRVRGPATNVDYLLPWGYTTIGRSTESNLVIEDSKVSRNSHLQIGCTVQGGWVLDQYSSNGSLRNGKEMEKGIPAPLVAGDRYEIGDHVIEVIADTATDGGSAFALPLELADEQAQQLPTARKPALQPATVPSPRAAQPARPAQPVRATQALEAVLPRESVRFMRYLPELYSHRDTATAAGDPEKPFLTRFLALFESLYLPLEWSVVNFDLMLDVHTAPPPFLAWWERWFDLSVTTSWRDELRRALLTNAYALFSRRGTHWALAQVLELYTGYTAQITEEGLPQHTFRVRAGLGPGADAAGIAALVELFKPAHTVCELTCEPMDSAAAYTDTIVLWI